MQRLERAGEVGCDYKKWYTRDPCDDGIFQYFDCLGRYTMLDMINFIELNTHTHPNKIIGLCQCQYPGCCTMVFQNVNIGRAG